MYFYRVYHIKSIYFFQIRNRIWTCGKVLFELDMPHVKQTPQSVKKLVGTSRVRSRQCSIPTLQSGIFGSSRRQKVSMTTRVTGISLVRVVDSYLRDAIPKLPYSYQPRRNLLASVFSNLRPLYRFLYIQLPDVDKSVWV